MTLIAVTSVNSHWQSVLSTHQSQQVLSGLLWRTKEINRETLPPRAERELPPRAKRELPPRAERELPPRAERELPVRRGETEVSIKSRLRVREHRNTFQCSAAVKAADKKAWCTNSSHEGTILMLFLDRRLK